MEPSYITKCAQIASVLEVSGHPKPGNVHRNQDFEDMVFEDFLISGVVLGEQIYEAARRGSRYQDDPSSWHKMRLGELIKDSVNETDLWVENNTNLGIVLLLVPLSAAAGMSNDLDSLRYNVDMIMRATTPQDAVNLYGAINIAEAGGMGDKDELSVSDDSSIQVLIEEEITMFDVLEMSAEWDLLSYELTNHMPVTFETGYPLFHELKPQNGINSATVQTFLNILAHHPDTLIKRKYGEEVASEVSQSAKSILDKGGILSKEGQSALYQFEEKLLSKNLNPGTSADLTASSIMVHYLGDYKKYHPQRS